MVLPSTEMFSRRPTSRVLRWYEAYSFFFVKLKPLLMVVGVEC